MREHKRQAWSSISSSNSPRSRRPIAIPDDDELLLPLELVLVLKSDRARIRVHGRLKQASEAFRQVGFRSRTASRIRRRLVWLLGRVTKRARVRCGNDERFASPSCGNGGIGTPCWKRRKLSTQRFRREQREQRSCQDGHAKLRVIGHDCLTRAGQQRVHSISKRAFGWGGKRTSRRLRDFG